MVDRCFSYLVSYRHDRPFPPALCPSNERGRPVPAGDHGHSYNLDACYFWNPLGTVGGLNRAKEGYFSDHTLMVCFLFTAYFLFEFVHFDIIRSITDFLLHFFGGHKCYGLGACACGRNGDLERLDWIIPGASHDPRTNPRWTNMGQLEPNLCLPDPSGCGYAAQDPAVGYNSRDIKSGR